MEKLVQLRCVAYRDGELPLTAAEVARYADQIPDWQVVQREGIDRLERCFKFENYANALAFTNRVGAIAETENHHPSLLTEWGQVTVTWWTHAVGGLHRNDLVMAAKTDRCM